MSVHIKTTEDGRKVEVIDLAICLDGKKEATELTPVNGHPNQEAILLAVPNATHMAGRLPLTLEEAKTAHEALEAAKLAYDNSPRGLQERMRKAQNAALSNRDG